MEMQAGGKPGNPNPGFPLFPPSLEIAARFPHSHRHDSSSYTHQRTRNRLRKSVTYVLGQKCYPCPRPHPLRRPARVNIFLLDLSVMVVADQREAPQALPWLSFLGK